MERKPEDHDHLREATRDQLELTVPRAKTKLFSIRSGRNESEGLDESSTI